MLNGNHYIFEQKKMYLNSHCGFTLAIPLLWTLHLDKFTRYVLGEFYQFCLFCIFFVLQTICKSILFFIYWTPGWKNLFYIIESDLRCPNYKILQLQCLYVNLKMNGIVFGVDTLLKEKIIFNINNHI